MTRKQEDQADLEWLRQHLPAAPSPDDPLTRQTIALARASAHQRAKTGKIPLWMAGLAAGAVVGVVVLTTPWNPPQMRMPSTEALVVMPTVHQANEKELEVMEQNMDAELLAEASIPEPPGMWELDVDDLTDEELANVTRHLLLRPRS